MSSTSDLKIFEEYLFAEDKESFLKTLIPGSEAYTFFKFLHILNTNSKFSKDEEKELKAYLKSSNSYSSAFNLRNLHIKSLILEYDQNPSQRSKIIETLNTEFLKLNFEHSSGVSTNPLSHRLSDSKSLKSELSPEDINLTNEINLVYKEKLQLSYFQNNLYHMFDVKSLMKNKQLMEDFLKNAEPSEFPDFVRMLWNHLRDYSHHNIQPNFYQNLDLNGMIELSKLNEVLLQDSKFVKMLFVQKFRLSSRSQSGLKLGYKETYDLLNEMYEYAISLRKIDEGVLSYLLFELLKVGLYLDKINENHFKEFLKSPTDKYNGIKDRKYSRPSSEFSIFESSVNLDLNKLIEKCFIHIFKSQSSYSSYEKYIEKDTLKIYFGLAKIEIGENSKELHDIFTERELKDFALRKEITILDTNPQYYPANQPVVLSLEIRISGLLLIKVFEIDAENYYIKKSSEIDENINLDGLIASEEITYTFKENTHTKVRKDFKFDSITNKPRGVFIIDFIGNGLCSRAIIRKGRLGLIEKQTVAGQVFNIVDEEYNICNSKDTGIWINDHFYPADVKGEILIPYGSSSSTSKGVLVHGGSAELVNIELKTENFDFRCAFIYKEESFLANHKAKVLVQPRLFINETPVGLGVIKSSSAQVIIYSDNNVPSTSNIDNFKLDVHKDNEIEFLVSPKTIKIEVVVNAKIPQIGSEENYEFKSSHTIYINQHLGDYVYYQPFLRLTPQGYCIHVLGKTGEPKKEVKVHLELTHKWYTQILKFELQTNKEGMIFLGELKNFKSLKVVLFGSKNHTTRDWTLNQTNFVEQPSSITINEGEKIELPLFDYEIKPQQITFFEVVSGNRVQNLIKLLALNNDLLTISDLKAGEYILNLRNDLTKITIKVLKGKSFSLNSNYICSENTLIPRKNAKSRIFIHDVKIEENMDASSTTLKIQTFSDEPKLTRFHIFGSQFIEPRMEQNILRLQNDKNGSLSTVNLNLHKNQFFINKQLGEETVYILDRKLKEKFVGNNLEKPPILLKRTFVKETSTSSEQLGEEKSYEKGDSGEESSYDFFFYPQKYKSRNRERDIHKESLRRDVPSKKKAKPSYQPARSMGSQDGGVDVMLNFLENSTLVLSNLTPDENGEIVLKDLPLEKYSYLQVIGTNMSSCCSRIITLKGKTLKTKDVTLKSNLKKDTFYTIKRETSVVLKGEKGIIKDKNSTEFQIIDTISKLYDAQINIIKGNESLSEDDYEEWSFLKDWHKLKIEEKLMKYDKYSSHELNLFLFFKDPNFFKDVVYQFLKNKIEKSVVDLFLLGKTENLLKYAEPNVFCKLPNPLEKVLIIYSLTKSYLEISKELAKHIESKAKLIKIQTNVFKRVFDSVLNAFSLEKVEKLGKVLNSISNMAGQPEMALINQMSNMNSMPMMSQMYVNPSFNPYSNISNMPRNGGPFSGLMIPNMKSMPGMARGMMQNMGMARNMDQSMASNYDAMNMERQLSGRADSYESLTLLAEQYIEKRVHTLKSYQNLEQTKEYCERNYFESISSVSFHENLFWSDLANHLIANPGKPFFTRNIIFANTCITELIAVLSFIGVDFEAQEPEYAGHEFNGLEIKAGGDSIIFQKQISEGNPEFNSEVLISQRFFDPEDRYIGSEDEPDVQIEKVVEKYLINKIYGCKVSVTNCSITNQEFQVLIEIPEGSIPINQVDYTKSHTIKLNAEATHSIETFFYFPYQGNFKVYPANISKNGRVMAQSKEKSFEVVEKITNSVFDNFSSLIEQGDQNDILQYVSTKNIFDSQVFDPSRIRSLLFNKSFYEKLISILREKRYYDEYIWSFGILHNIEPIIKEYLQSNSKVQTEFKYLKSSLIKVDNFSVYEYSPLVNQRAHLLANEKNQILNNDFKRKYQEFIIYLSEVPKLEVRHYISLVYYLLLQDRIKEAMTFFDKIDPMEHQKREDYQIQYDYIAAYLDFFRGHPEYKVARDVSYKYLTYPVLSWRSLFVQMANYLAEFDGDELIDDSLLKKSKQEENSKNALKEEIIEISLEGTKVVIHHQNVKEATLSFFKVDLEILFSRNPFFTKMQDEFTFIKANYIHELDFSLIEDTKSFFEIPPELQKNDLFIQIKSQDKFDTTNYYSSTLNVDIMENYGQLKVTNLEGVPITKAYVKCFVKLNDGSTNFYKDGYTDIRGKFEYASSNNSENKNISRFSILILTDNGSIIKEAQPPTKMAKIEDNLMIRSKNPKYDVFKNDPIQQNFINKFNKFEL